MNVNSDTGHGPVSMRKMVLAVTTVFAVAVAARVPSCYESFWVDELHTAWSVWDRFGDVGPRATLGHQSPFYFQGLWLWKQVVGGSEVALRLSSVLAVAAASAILTFDVTRWTRSLAAGVVAGMILAIESNSLFFGTELRPYAVVILFSTVAVTRFVNLSSLPSRDRSNWPILIVSILLALLAQPTSVGVLAWLPATLLAGWLVRDPKRTLRMTRDDAILLTCGVIVAFVLWKTTLQPTWTNKQAWASFASADSLWRLWNAWPWTWLALVPMAITSVVLLNRAIKKRPLASPGGIEGVTITLAMIAILSTSVYWLAAWCEWLPIWHRRYYVAGLPILACVVGGAIGTVARSGHRASRMTAGVTAAAILFALIYQQGTLGKFTGYPVALVRRNENWRSAVAWIEQQAETRRVLIYVDSGLIEGRYLTQDGQRSSVLPATLPNVEHVKYLTFPVRGPYALQNDVRPTDPQFASLRGNPPSVTAQTQVLILTRRPGHRVPTVNLPDRAQIRKFANVSVVILPSEQ